MIAVEMVTYEHNREHSSHQQYKFVVPEDFNMVHSLNLIGRRTKYKGNKNHQASKINLGQVNNFHYTFGKNRRPFNMENRISS